MKINITRRFTGVGNRLFGPGPITLDDALAKDLIAQGRAEAIESDDVSFSDADFDPEIESVEDYLKPPWEEEGEEDAEEEHPLGDTERFVQGIPEDFPEANKLAAAGITTIEDLKDPGLRDRLDGIKGIGPATINKIAAAIAELD